MSRTRRTTQQVLAAAALVVAVASASGCSSPGSTTGEESPAEETPAVADRDGGEAPDCGTEPVTLNAYFETGFPLPTVLAEEFSEQYPNVTFDIREDQFAVLTQNAPRVLADDPPDLMRLPQVSNLAEDGLLKNLDSYAEAFGWDEWPASQLEQLRVDEEGRRGDGPLYAMGLNYSLTGVFYNKELAEQIGMTEPPATLDDFDAYLQAAEEAGLTPIAQFNGGATGGLAFPLQALMASYGDPAEINDWIFQQEGATIETPENVEATEHLQGWIDAGYFADDVNSLDYSMMMSRFIGGESVFIFNGDWESGNLDEQMPGNVGFFLMPPLEEGGTFGAMSAPLTFGIAEGAENADCAAFFLDWVATDETARTIGVEVGGSHPMGPADAFMPEVDPDTVTAQTLEAGAALGEQDGAMDFIANATGSIYAKGWTPNLQRLVAGEQDPAGLLAAVQTEYESEAGN